MAYEDLKPSDILSPASFRNAMAVVAAIGGSTNAQPHLVAMARHAGLDITADDRRAVYPTPLIVSCQPAGKYLGERFHRAGGVPAAGRTAGRRPARRQRQDRHRPQRG